jgi:threonine aldolase
LAEDHRRAKFFADRVRALPGLTIDPESVQTNIVVIDVRNTKKTPAQILRSLRSKNLLLTDAGPTAIRAVTHMDVSDDDLEAAIRAFTSVFR